jgi:hypothetical protein
VSRSDGAGLSPFLFGRLLSTDVGDDFFLLLEVAGWCPFKSCGDVAYSRNFNFLFKETFFN